MASPPGSLCKIKWPKVYLLGDSITQYSFNVDEGCWGALLQQHLQRKADVCNRGFAGYNTTWDLINAKRVFHKYESEETMAVTILLGANDSNTADNGIQHVPIEKYGENLCRIVAVLVKLGVSKDKILIIGPPACDVEKWAQHCDTYCKTFTKSNELTEKYSEMARKAAKACGVEFLDVWHPMMEQPDWRDFLLDGLHFTRTGADWFFELLRPYMDKRTCQLTMIQPGWDEVDYKNPKNNLNLPQALHNVDYSQCSHLSQEEIDEMKSKHPAK